MSVVFCLVAAIMRPKLGISILLSQQPGQYHLILPIKQENQKKTHSHAFRWADLKSTDSKKDMKYFEELVNEKKLAARTISTGAANRYSSPDFPTNIGCI